MFSKLKTALVESYVGAIALGWIFAQSILHLVGVITTPLSVWEQQRFMRELRIGDVKHLGFPFQSSIPQLIAAIALALVGWLLLRWLYYSPNVNYPAVPDETASSNQSS